MALNKRTGNMYPFITHTWNPIQGRCIHGCRYCYMKTVRNRYKKPENKIQLKENYLKDNLNKGKYIFIGSSCDLFAADVPSNWVLKVLDYTKLFDAKYLFQTKNPFKVLTVYGMTNFPVNSVLCITLESNRGAYDGMYNCCPAPAERVEWFKKWQGEKMITIEPIMDFDLVPFVKMIESCKPSIVNIGADSGNNNLIEPPKEKITELITVLENFTKVNLKKNIKRLFKEKKEKEL